jgi:phenylacetate-coenzyme A ligase PaaK-like adenylate-forming protein
MKDLTSYFNSAQYSIPAREKSSYLLELVNSLHLHHLEDCGEYKKISERIFKVKGKVKDIKDLPFLPVSIFKERIMKSIPDGKVFKVLTSSGTTGSVPGRIFLDTETANFQTLALSKIITHIIGQQRLPMLIVDSRSVLSDRKSYSARGAGILGLSVFGKDHHYLLDASYEPDHTVFADFIEKYNGKPMLIFGFTFMIWQYLFRQRYRQNADLSKAVLIHSGGWKKLNDQKVDNETFKNSLQKKFGLNKVYNFYGMVEQVGSVFLENRDGYLHCPNFSDIIIRDPVDFSILPQGREGLVQVISVLPKSYPGHSLLTEDIGVCLGEDNSSNGWKGKYFRIIGRAEKAELRGCSDTFATKF